MAMESRSWADAHGQAIPIAIRPAKSYYYLALVMVAGGLATFVSHWCPNGAAEGASLVAAALAAKKLQRALAREREHRAADIARLSAQLESERSAAQSELTSTVAACEGEVKKLKAKIKENHCHSL